MSSDAGVTLVWCLPDTLVLFGNKCLQILTIAVIGILVTSPIGAIGITVAGPQMLQQAQPGFVTVNAHTEQGKSERAAKQKPSLKITTV